jgi:hypothetical protein
MAVFVEDWAVTHGSPYLVETDEGDGAAELVEDGAALRKHRGRVNAGEARPLAFVDGVRRVEAYLWREEAGTRARGVVGAHAAGAAVIREGQRATFERVRSDRVLVWGGGLRQPLSPPPPAPRWRTLSIADDDPVALVGALQERMRVAEAEIAEGLSSAGFLAIQDGSLSRVRDPDEPIVGYVKTHHRMLLSPEHHAHVGELDAGERTSLFAIAAGAARSRTVYSAYVRLTPRGPMASAWAGIVRIEIPQVVGLVEARRLADHVAFVLPRFAGVPHVDPRAPQNLQPIGALESHLRHLLGDPGLATRAVRDTVGKSHEA